MATRRSPRMHSGIWRTAMPNTTQTTRDADKFPLEGSHYFSSLASHALFEWEAKEPEILGQANVRYLFAPVSYEGCLKPDLKFLRSFPGLL